MEPHREDYKPRMLLNHSFGFGDNRNSNNMNTILSFINYVQKAVLVLFIEQNNKSIIYHYHSNYRDKLIYPLCLAKHA